LHCGVIETRVALVVLAAAVAGLAATSGGSGADPQTPPALPGMPAPFLGTAVVGSGGLTAAIDAYGDVVDMRASGSAGAPLIDNPADRQAAGSVSPRTGIVPLVRIEGRALPMWRASSADQRYLPGTNVVRTVASFGLGGGRREAARVAITDAARGQTLARLIRVEGPASARPAPLLSIHLDGKGEAKCEQDRRGGELALLCSPWGNGASRHNVFAAVRRTISSAAERDRGWLARARPLGSGAPRWAKRMYGRSLLVLHALTNRRTGAVIAGARDGWAYVWPRDAAAVALALESSGYRREARLIARFLSGLDLGAGARFDGAGRPVPGRAAQGDAAAWTAVAARATGLPSDSPTAQLRRGAGATPWPGRSDYQEGSPGEYLANAIAARNDRLRRPFETRRGLVRRAGDPASGLDSAAAWAVRPFPQPALFPEVRRTLLRLLRGATPFGITPGEAWEEADPWTAPTAWSAWSLAALGARGPALRLLADLRRAATPAGDLPERVDARSGVPRSTTPLAWSHAFVALALRELWPRKSQSRWG
jgi:hypothetical protein